jgi:hypothetical protein
VVETGYVVRAVPSLSCEEAIAATEAILAESDSSSGWNCLFIGDETHRFCNRGEEATYSTAPLFIEELPGVGGPKAPLAPTFDGSAHVVTSYGDSFTYSVLCARVDGWVAVATPNIAMEARTDRTYTDSLIPADDSPYMYLVDDPPTGSVAGTTTTYGSPVEAESLSAQGSFAGDLGFGGSLDYLVSATLSVSADSLSGKLSVDETGGTGYVLTWRCASP